jgi:hypothetical protein
MQLGQLLYSSEYVLMPGRRLACRGLLLGAALCVGLGDVFVPFALETTGRPPTSTPPNWLEKLGEPDPACCCEKPLI